MLPKSLEPIVWMLGIALLYGGIGGAIVLALLAARTRRAPMLAAVAITALVAVILYTALPLSLSPRLLIGGLLTVGLELALWRFVMRPYLAWHDLKFGKEAVRQTILHSVLLTGSVIFLVPFAWLVVTSLKEDSGDE